MHESVGNPDSKRANELDCKHDFKIFCDIVGKKQTNKKSLLQVCCGMRKVVLVLLGTGVLVLLGTGVLVLPCCSLPRSHCHTERE